MNINKNKERRQIEFINMDDKVILRIFIMPDELVWAFDKSVSKQHPIEIFREDDRVFFDNLSWFMDQEYAKKEDNHYQLRKEKDKFTWCSEHINVNEDNPYFIHTCRLEIKRTSDSFIIFPFILDKDSYSTNVCTFSFRGNKFDARNLESEKHIQEDMLTFYKKTYANKYIITHKNKKIVKE